MSNMTITGARGHMLRFELPELKSETKQKTVTGEHEMAYVNGMFLAKYRKVVKRMV